MLFASVLGAAIALGLSVFIFPSSQTESMINQSDSAMQKTMRFSAYENAADNYVIPEGLNFIHAAQTVIPAVVYIENSQYINQKKGESSDPLEEYFHDYFKDRNSRQRPVTSGGSGVIISQDGYIVTNNHVVENSKTLNVILNDKREYEAEVIGTDPTTDLALIKIADAGLPFIEISNSDNVQVGEWVLAVGNPFDLTSTVTAGIVSAKSRNVRLLGEKAGRYAIESFIQTDAVVNPGNSGGALVDLKGRLIGINTAIATRTGYFSGYSFAVPSLLVKKVVNDLREFGVVKRGLLGVSIRDINAEVAEEYDLKDFKGVLIAGISENSGAEDAGIESGDVVLAVGEVAVNSVAALQEQVAQRRAGDQVEITIRRGNEESKKKVTLKGYGDEVTLSGTAQGKKIQKLGIMAANISKEEKNEYGVQHGVKVIGFYEDSKLSKSGMSEGFIITFINEKPIKSISDLQRTLRDISGSRGLLIEGVDSEGNPKFYGVGM